MSKTMFAATIAAVGLIAALPASAAVGTDENPSGFYAGAGWGQFNLDIDNLNEAGNAVSDIVKSDDNAWKIFAGYRVNQYLSLEAAYIDFGRPRDRFTATGSSGNYRVDLSGFAPYVIGTLPLGPVELFAKAGYYFYDVDVRVDFDSPGPGVDSSHSGSDFIYGGGLGVTIFDRVNLRAEYEIVDLERAPNSDALWLSASFRF